MASGPIVGGDDGAKEKPRYSENKVYTRKAFKGPKNKANALAPVVADAAPTTATANNNSKKDSTVNNGNVNETQKNDANVSAQQPLAQSIEPKDGNSAQPRPNSGLNVVSDDSSALNRQQDEPSILNCQQEEPSSRNCQQEEPSSLNCQQEEPSSLNGQQEEPSSLNGQQEEPSSLNGQQEEPSSLNGQQEEPSSLNGQQEEPSSLNGQQEEPSSLSPQQEEPSSPNGQQEEPSGLNRQQEEPSGLNGQQEEPSGLNGQQEEPSGLNGQQEEPSGLNGQQEEPSGLNDQQEEPSSLNGPQEEPSSLNNQQEEPSSPNHQQEEPSGLNGQQEEPSGPNPRQDTAPSTLELPSGNGTMKPGLESRIMINLASKSKQEMRELRMKLVQELHTVRSLVKRIEVKQGQLGGHSNSNLLVSDRVDKSVRLRRVHSEVASTFVPRESARPLNQLSISVLENSQGVSENVEKEKRTPKANQFYRNSEFLLGKDKFPPAEGNKKSKLNGKKQGGGETGHVLGMGAKFFKSCSSLLEKLMKHNYGWVFNAPVDVEGLGLHDYFTIITHPMDLGTVKTRLSKNWYKSPKEFAEDVRLTFRNAMTYNPPGQDVHIMAEQLSKIFEDRWAIIESDYNREMRYAFDYGVSLPAPSPLSRKPPALPPPPLDMRRILDRSESMTKTAKPMSITPSSRTPLPKKPKAKDPHKRDMTYEEKQKLSTNLQSLPIEKLDTIIQIIKKRNSALSQHDDEIEVDIDSVDAETLWELDRFFTNYKKSLSKNKRKAELAMQKAEAAKNGLQKEPVTVTIPEETIEGERNISTSVPAQGEMQVDNGSRTSSSSSSSSDSGSSSSDSDSESSSASGSDAGSPRT